MGPLSIEDELLHKIDMENISLHILLKNQLARLSETWLDTS